MRIFVIFFVKSIHANSFFQYFNLFYLGVNFMNLRKAIRDGCHDLRFPSVKHIVKFSRKLSSKRGCGWLQDLVLSHLPGYVILQAQLVIRVNLTPFFSYLLACHALITFLPVDNFHNLQGSLLEFVFGCLSLLERNVHPAPLVK